MHSFLCLSHVASLVLGESKPCRRCRQRACRTPRRCCSTEGGGSGRWTRARRSAPVWVEVVWVEVVWVAVNVAVVVVDVIVVVVKVRWDFISKDMRGRG